MAKIIMFNLISLDGFFAGINGNINWHKVDDEFNRFAIKQTGEFGTIIFGRVTYQLFEKFWPKVLGNEKFSKEDQEIAKIIDNIEKIVFSKKLNRVNWGNSTLYKKIDTNLIKDLKKKRKKDLAIFGSGEIVQEMADLNLIDEYRFLVNPVVLGKGKPLFKNVKQLSLKLKN